MTVELRTFGSVDLRWADGRTLHALLAQSKRLGLLVYLAAAVPRGYHRRDSLLPLFWPDMDQERARGALRKALHALRHALSADSVPGRGDDEIAVGDGIWCDAVAFDAAVERGALREALEHYRGEFLDGFFLSETPEFERWLEGERSRYRRKAAAAAWQLSSECEGTSVHEAVTWARRAMELVPDDEVGLRRLLTLLERAGDHAGIAHAFDEYRRRLEREFQLAPAMETVALVEALRTDASRKGAQSTGSAVKPLEANRAPIRLQVETHSGHSTPPDPFTVSGNSSGHAPGAFDVADTSNGGTRRRRAAIAAAAVATLTALSLVTFVAGPSRADQENPIVAVGHIQDFTGETGRAAAAIPNMLVTSLARSPDVRVISGARIQAILVAVNGQEGDAHHFPDAARRSGARYLIEGALYRRAEHPFQLELRAVDLETGAVTGAYSEPGSDLFAVVERLTGRILAGFGAGEVSGRLADVTTTSLVAHRFFTEGLRRHYSGDYRAAFQFFTAALEEDSTFAMAAYYAGLAKLTDWQQMLPLLARAETLASRSTERERLLIRGQHARYTDNPALLAYAETLATRYSLEPEGHFLYGWALSQGGDFLGSVPHLRHAISLDSVSLRGMTPRCTACDALEVLRDAYLRADSAAAAERMAREWTGLQPSNRSAWNALADALEIQGRVSEAYAANRRAAALHPDHGLLIRLAMVDLREGNHRAADRRFAELVSAGTASERSSARWYWAISLRNQGRHEEALSLLRQMLAERQETGTYLHAAQVLREMGRDREALVFLDSARRLVPPYTPSAPGWVARGHVWSLTHLAETRASMLDTAALPVLADSIRLLGERSAYGRDRRLHHHVYGLLYAARGDHMEAAAAFRRAIYSPSLGYTRSNLELARSLLRLGRAADAAAILQPALRGSMEASNLYVTRTELHELLATAFELAGEPDSAAAHRRRVLLAWSHAAPHLHARRTALRDYALLRHGEPTR